MAKYKPIATPSQKEKIKSKLAPKKTKKDAAKGVKEGSAAAAKPKKNKDKYNKEKRRAMNEERKNEKESRQGAAQKQPQNKDAKPAAEKSQSKNAPAANKKQTDRKQSQPKKDAAPAQKQQKDTQKQPPKQLDASKKQTDRKQKQPKKDTAPAPKQQKDTQKQPPKQNDASKKPDQKKQKKEQAPTTPAAEVTTPVAAPPSKKKARKEKQKQQQQKTDATPASTPAESTSTSTPATTSKKTKRRDSSASKSQEPARKKRKVDNANNTRKPQPLAYNPLSSIVLNASKAAQAKAQEAVSSQETHGNPTSTLVSSQFRLLNEKYYVQNSNQMMKYLNENPSAFDVYHKGFEQSRKKWNFDPFTWIVPSLVRHFEERCVKKISKHRERDVRTFKVVDMGCGHAELELLFRAAVEKKHGDALKSGKLKYEIQFENLDMMAANERVKVADMRDTKLPAAQYDAVVFSLSLMGTNYVDFLVEGFRLLKKGGIMPIVELESRVVDPSEFMFFMHDHLFMNKVTNDLKKGYFQYYLFQKKNFRDMPREVSGVRLQRELLMPSLYKKR